MTTSPAAATGRPLFKEAVAEMPPEPPWKRARDSGSAVDRRKNVRVCESAFTFPASATRGLRASSFIRQLRPMALNRKGGRPTDSPWPA